MRSERLESPHVIVKILNALKGFYTFKELEEKLHIPSQMLWRYTSLISYPERKTAREILTRIEEARLIEQIISRVITVNSYGYIETWKYLYDIRFLDLVGYKAMKFTGDTKIDVVIAFPESCMALAVVIAAWLNSRAYVIKEEPTLSALSYLNANYISKDRGRIVTIYIPPNIIKRGGNILLVKNIVKNWQSITAAHILVEKAGAKIWGAMGIVSISNEWLESLKKVNVKNVNILKSLQHSSSYT